MRTGNPALGSSTFDKVAGSRSDAGVMTLQGTINKTGLLTLIVLVSAMITWTKFFANPEQGAQNVSVYLLVMLLAYSSKLIKVTENLKMGIVAATGAIFVYYLISFVLGIFGVKAPLINDNGWMGILFSLFVVGVAAFNLVLDFDFIESGVSSRAPGFMEWYAAFGLMVTLIWLYVEILRLLSKLRSRN